MKLRSLVIVLMTTGHLSVCASSVLTLPALSTPALVAPPRVVMTRELYVAGHARAHPELCPAQGARLRLVVLVTSAPAHFAQRVAVRFTWGHFAARADVALGFVLGEPPATLRTQLDEEDALYRDLIEGNSVDSYSNLTLKTLSMLEWMDTYCPLAPRLLKTDDDVFINVPRLLEFAVKPVRINASRTVWGQVLKRKLPYRTPGHKYYLSPEQFPGSMLPKFATGPAYLLTTDCVRSLLVVALGRPYMHLEDVFVTGLLATEARVRRVHAPLFYNNHRMDMHPCTVQRGIAIHNVRFQQQFVLWRRLFDDKTECPFLRVTRPHYTPGTLPQII